MFKVNKIILIVSVVIITILWNIIMTNVMKVDYTIKLKQKYVVNVLIRVITPINKKRL